MRVTNADYTKSDTYIALTWFRRSHNDSQILIIFIGVYFMEFESRYPENVKTAKQ